MLVLLTKKEFGVSKIGIFDLKGIIRQNDNIQLYSLAISFFENCADLQTVRIFKKIVVYVLKVSIKINKFVFGCTFTVSANTKRQILRKKRASPQQAVWRKRGCCLVGHFAGIWKFSSRPSLTDTPA